MLKNFIKLFLSLWVILIVLGFLNKTLADDHPLFPDGVMRTTQVPIFCGQGPVVFSYATSIFKQKSVAWSEVTQNGDPNTEPFAWVSFWYSPELNNGSMFLTIAETGETCLMGYGMNWNFDTEMLLDIVNDSYAEESE